MGFSLVEKIIQEHIIDGKMETGNEISIKIDQTLLPDSSGTMACLEFETLDVSRVQIEKPVCYVDHNTLQIGFENADDHLFLKTFSEKYGMIFSRPGNGICHQLHIQRFAKPGETLLGADSHTPTSGALGMLAIGVGGLDIASVMAGLPYFFKMPKIVNIIFKGKLRLGVSAKDIILFILGQLGVKAGLGKIFEYTGPGINTLGILERATIANMGTELGAMSSIFPSDRKTYEFMKAQGREKDLIEIKPDKTAKYDRKITINLDNIEPMVAMPHSPDNVTKVKELKDIKVDQVFIGSCTNSSYLDLMKVAYILDGKKIHPDVSLVIAPGSYQIYRMAIRDGLIEKLVSVGARILECACGPCVGVGQAPPSEGVSLRTTNRNFKGRSGTDNALVYLASPETAAVTALNGKISDPREISNAREFKEPLNYLVDDSLFIFPKKYNPENTKVKKGPNIKPFPLRKEIENELCGQVVIKLGDNITTDDIMPAGTKLLSLRSNIPAISNYVFSKIDPLFVERIKGVKDGFIIAGENYGQGSSREHAALAPMYLGVKVVIAKSFAKIHFNNLINFGIIPLIFKNKEDYEKIEKGDSLKIEDIKNILKNKQEVIVNVESKNIKIIAIIDLSKRIRAILLAGGLLNYVKKIKTSLG